MKCPVCDLENSTMLCTQCGSDASQNYEQYPTFGKIGKASAISARRKELNNLQNKPNGPQFVDYRKMVSRAAEEDTARRSTREYQLLTELQAANDTISGLKRELDFYRKRIRDLEEEQKAVTSYLVPENEQLREQVHALDQSNKLLIQERETMETDMETLSGLLTKYKDKVTELLQTNDDLLQKYKASEQSYDDLAMHNHQLRAEAQDLRKRILELEAEHNRSLMSRLFNR